MTGGGWLGGCEERGHLESYLLYNSQSVFAKFPYSISPKLLLLVARANASTHHGNMPASEVLFNPGRVVASPAVLELLQQAGIDPFSLLDRHVSGDFGEVGKMEPGCLVEDGSEHSDGLVLNSLAVVSGDERILSVYRVTDDDRVYVETVADRSYTTIYLPEEY
jgi:hypothetical protein